MRRLEAFILIVFFSLHYNWATALQVSAAEHDSFTRITFIDFPSNTGQLNLTGDKLFVHFDNPLTREPRIFLSKLQSIRVAGVASTPTGVVISLGCKCGVAIANWGEILYLDFSENLVRQDLIAFEVLDGSVKILPESPTEGDDLHSMNATELQKFPTFESFQTNIDNTGSSFTFSEFLIGSTSNRGFIQLDSSLRNKSSIAQLENKGKELGQVMLLVEQGQLASMGKNKCFDLAAAQDGINKTLNEWPSSKKAALSVVAPQKRQLETSSKESFTFVETIKSYIVLGWKREALLLIDSLENDTLKQNFLWIFHSLYTGEKLPNAPSQLSCTKNGRHFSILSTSKPNQFDQIDYIEAVNFFSDLGGEIEKAALRNILTISRTNGLDEVTNYLLRRSQPSLLDRDTLADREFILSGSGDIWPVELALQLHEVSPFDWEQDKEATLVHLASFRPENLESWGEVVGTHGPSGLLMHGALLGFMARSDFTSSVRVLESAMESDAIDSARKVLISDDFTSQFNNETTDVEKIGFSSDGTLTKAKNVLPLENQVDLDRALEEAWIRTREILKEPEPVIVNVKEPSPPSPVKRRTTLSNYIELANSAKVLRERALASLEAASSEQ